MNGTRDQLWIDLKRIEEDKYQLKEGEVLWDYITLMLQYIGDPHPDLRDELIYPTFYEWIMVRQVFDQDELRRMLSILLDEHHLFYHIGSEGDSSVFTRTFSILVVTLIVQRHIQISFLSETEFDILKNSILRYYQEEKDLRGFLDESGWAHGAAHGADALEELVKCKESDKGTQQEILASVRAMLYNGHHMFSDEEDERIASILDTIIFNQFLPHTSVVKWISQLEECCSWPRSRSQYITRVNTKNFLRSLYFRLIHNNRGIEYIDSILHTEAVLNKFV